jgi:ubiquinone biosynthesis protein
LLFDGTFRNINRTRTIIKVLLKYGFEDLVTNTPLQKVIPRRLLLKWIRDERHVTDSTRWERVRMAIEELGPTFIKIAQILSNRPDLIPNDLILEFEKLQNEVAPTPFPILKARVEKEMGKPLEEMFASFDEKPIGSASIGVVHRATLLTGEDVVVKVRRPNVARIMHEDLEILKYVVSKADKYLEEQGMPNASDAVSAFESSMLKELDYKNEGKNIENFRNFYKDYKNFYVPKAYRKISTEKVLVIEFVSGCKITDVKQIRKWGLSPEKIAELGMDVYLMQIFEFGYFHSDPHPGNILVTPEGTLILIDFGMLGKLMKQDKFAFANVMIAMGREDAQSMARNLKKLSIEDDIDDMKLLENDLNEIIDEYANVSVEDSSIEDMINDLQGVMYKYKMRVPGGVFLIFRALAVLEGIGKIMHPQFNISQFVKPYGVKMIKEQYAPKELLETAWYKSSEIFSLLNSIPSEFSTILKKTRKGDIKIKVDHQGYEPLMNKLDRVINRFILTFIIFTLTISSSILTLADMPAKLISPLGIPYLSLIGYGSSMVLGTVLLFAVLRSRKM